MLKYTIKRLLVAIPTFFGITVLVYLISLLAPGSPLEMLMADPMAPQQKCSLVKRRSQMLKNQVKQLNFRLK